MKKKITLGIVMVVCLMFFAGCDKTIKLKTDEVKIGKNVLIPKKASVNNDILKVDVEWKFGKQSDSMNKENFNQQNIYFYAYQNDELLKLVINGYFIKQRANETYEGSKRTLMPEFYLKDKKSDVTFVIREEYPGKITTLSEFTFQL